jgi:glycosyltransferase involved in cell wall biosynthesis
MPTLSVIIPTYNRCDILEICLKALEAQSLAKDRFEVMVINDGSTDETEEKLKKLQKELKTTLHYHEQKNKGQGSARNLGIKKAQGEIVVFIGDDIIVEPDFLEQHLRYHTDHPEINEAVLGYVTWHKDIQVSPFMHFLEHGGHQFAYDQLQGKKLANYNYFYTANISIKKELLSWNPFDEDFKKYGWEDIELGYRLEKDEDMKLYYNPRAIGYHHHHIEEDSFQHRMHAVGKSAHIFHKKHPELHKVPPFWKYLAMKVGANNLTIKTAKHLNKHLYYTLLTKKYFVEGLESAIPRRK